MAEQAEIVSDRKGNRWRVLGWGMATGPILLPLVAMQFTSEVNWTVGDFLFATLMIGSVGLAFELVVRASNSTAYRAGAATALAAAFLTVWVNGAVGMIGSEDNPYNLLFLGVIVLALIGSTLARFRARGMMLAMATCAVAQAFIGLFGLSADLRGGILATGFAAIWLVSAALFRNAAR